MKFPFHPKLLDTLPGYGKGQLSHDVSAGLTVGVLALPLAMAFAIASGDAPIPASFSASWKRVSAFFSWTSPSIERR